MAELSVHVMNLKNGTPWSMLDHDLAKRPGESLVVHTDGAKNKPDPAPKQAEDDADGADWWLAHMLS